MSVHIRHSLDPAMESILLLERTVSQQSGAPGVIAMAAQTVSEKNHIPLPELEVLTQPLLAFEADLREALLPREDLWCDMFYPGADVENHLPWGLYYLENSGQLPAQGAFPLHHLLLDTLEDPALPAEAGSDLDAFLDYLDRRSCSDRTKWICTQVWRQPEQFYWRYRAMVQLAEPVVRRHEAALAPLVEASVQWVAQTVATDPEALWSELGISVHIPGALVIMPTAINMKGIGFVWDSAANQDSAAHLIVGLLRQPIQDLIHRYSNSSEFMAERLKSLSDQRRLEILKALKIKPRYGQELAELLGLTPATISHHMNSLVSDGFVTVDRQGVRGNYSLNSKNLDLFLQSLRSTLL